MSARALRTGGALAVGAAVAVGAASGASREPTSFRFARSPIVVYATEGRSAQWAIIVRLNKPLPTGADHRPRADLRVDHEPSDSGASRVGSRKGRACYLASYSSENDKPGAPQLVKPRDGQRVAVTLYFNKRKSVSIRARAERQDALADVNTREGVQPSLQRLGCLA